MIFVKVSAARGVGSPQIILDSPPINFLLLALGPERKHPERLDEREIQRLESIKFLVGRQNWVTEQNRLTAASIQHTKLSGSLWMRLVSIRNARTSTRNAAIPNISASPEVHRRSLWDCCGEAALL